MANHNIHGLILSNRDLETFAVDATGSPVLEMLHSDAMKRFKQKHPHVPIFVQGNIGLIGDHALDYVKKIKDAGASGAIVGSALARRDEYDGETAVSSIMEEWQHL